MLQEVENGIAHTARGHKTDAKVHLQMIEREKKPGVAALFKAVSK